MTISGILHASAKGRGQSKKSGKIIANTMCGRTFRDVEIQKWPDGDICPKCKAWVDLAESKPLFMPDNGFVFVKMKKVRTRRTSGGRLVSSNQYSKWYYRKRKKHDPVLRGGKILCRMCKLEHYTLQEAWRCCW